MNVYFSCFPENEVLSKHHFALLSLFCALKRSLKIKPAGTEVTGAAKNEQIGESDTCKRRDKALYYNRLYLNIFFKDRQKWQSM